MKAVVQRVLQSTVTVDETIAGRIGPGLLVLLGVAEGDGTADADYMADKMVHLRIFEDLKGKMNRSLLDVAGEMLMVSQFTLMGDCCKGRRPSFIRAAAPDTAKRLFDDTVDRVRAKGVRVETGIFGATMAVALINDGPVTLVLDSGT